MSATPQRIEELLVNARKIELRNCLSVGEDVGTYTVVDSSDRRLKLAFSSGVALFILIAGALLLLLDIWLFKTGTIGFMAIMPKSVKGAIIALPIIALFAIFMLGRSYDFEQGGKPVRRRWLWAFGSDTDPACLAAVALRIRPAASANAADWIEVNLVDSRDTAQLKLLEDQTDNAGAGATLTAAIQISRILSKPLRVVGEAREMPDHFRDALSELKQRFAPQ